MKVAGDHVHSLARGNRPRLLMTALYDAREICYIEKIVKSVP